MPRAWGYIFVLIAVLAAVGALLYPLPETYEQPVPEAPQVEPAVKPVKRSSQKAGQAARPKRATQSPKATPPVLPPKLPSRDTTKSRIMIPPRPAGK